MESEILITPDQKGLILGIDWLKKHGRFKWDFEKRRIKFGDEDWIELQRERVVLQEERELTPERLCVRQIRIPNTCLRNSQDDTSVLVGESRCSSMERILCSQVFLYYQLLSRAKTCKDRNRRKGPRVGQCMLQSASFCSDLSKLGQHSNSPGWTKPKFRLHKEPVSNLTENCSWASHQELDCQTRIRRCLAMEARTTSSGFRGSLC